MVSTIQRDGLIKKASEEDLNMLKADGATDAVLEAIGSATLHPEASAKPPSNYQKAAAQTVGDPDKAFAEAQTLLKVYPSTKLIMAISAPAVPGAAEAVRQAGRRDVDVIGLSLPTICKPYIHDGVVQSRPHLRDFLIFARGIDAIRQ